MPSDRGVSGFWLDIKALENARTTLIAELGAKEGMLAYGVWVRLFTWQYHSASPIKDAAHVARLTNLHIHKAQLLWRLLPQLLPRSLIRSPHGLLCRKTMVVLGKYGGESWAWEKPKVSESSGDSDSDSEEEKKEKKEKNKIPPNGGAKGAPIGMWKVAENLLGNRALVGRLVKQYGEELVMVAIARLASMRNPPEDPKAYVVAMLDERSAKTPEQIARDKRRTTKNPHGLHIWELNT